jgi:hypothetical protein
MLRIFVITIGLFVWLPVQAVADEAADQIERAQLLRELLETRPSTQIEGGGMSLPGAKINAAPVPAVPDLVRRQQFEDSQWRSLLGSQQMQIHAPESQAIPQGQWRSQMFERDRQAEDLSTDILRRSREWTNGRR